MKSYILHRISLLSAFKFGFLIGLITLFLPVVVGTLIAWGIISDLATWMAGLTYSFGVAGIPDIDGVKLLKAEAAFDLLKSWAALSTWQVLLLALGFWLALSILNGLWAMLAAASFNGLAALAGGLNLTLSEGVVQPVAQPKVGAQPVKRRIVWQWPFQIKQTPQSPAPLPQPVAGPAVAVSGPRLEISAPRPQVVAIAKPVVLIGSDPAADIRLDGLLPRHAQLRLENGRYILQDFSGGQTWVQGRPIAGLNMVKDGFTVQLGQWTMVFRQ
jgi:hypothetical protein